MMTCIVGTVRQLSCVRNRNSRIGSKTAVGVLNLSFVIYRKERAGAILSRESKEGCFGFVTMEDKASTVAPAFLASRGPARNTSSAPHR